MPKIVDHDARRQAIVEAMWRVVLRDGFAAVSVRSVAAEAEMSKTMIGHYFAKQADVLALAVEQTIDSVTEQIDADDLDELTLDRAVSIVLTMIPTTKRRRQEASVWLALLAESERDPDLRPVLSHLNASVLDGARQLLDGMRSSGLLARRRDVELEARRLHALIDGLSLQSLTDPGSARPKVVRSVVTDHLAGLAV